MTASLQGRQVMISLTESELLAYWVSLAKAQFEPEIILFTVLAADSCPVFENLFHKNRSDFDESTSHEVNFSLHLSGFRFPKSLNYFISNCLYFKRNLIELWLRMIFVSLLP